MGLKLSCKKTDNMSINVLNKSKLKVHRCEIEEVDFLLPALLLSSKEVGKLILNNEKRKLKQFFSWKHQYGTPTTYQEEQKTASLTLVSKRFSCMLMKTGLWQNWKKNKILLGYILHKSDTAMGKDYRIEPPRNI